MLPWYGMKPSDSQWQLLGRGVMDLVPRALAEEKMKSGKKLRLYLGIDPTGAQLHVGHSVPLLKLRDFQDAGHHVIFLIGSFTATIGDPTGRDKQREPLTQEHVMKNFETYKEQAKFILDFSKIEVVYNHEWLGKMSFSEILKLASHFTIQQMMERDMFKERMSWKVVCIHCGKISNSPIQFKDEAALDSAELKGNTTVCPHCGKITPCNKENIKPPENPVSPTEFFYPLMQGYDSVVLDVDFEVGGNDQLFNMLCGRKLQKVFGKRDKFVLTTKLIEGTDGRKMSKTYQNCIYLTDSANEMYGKVMSVQDKLILLYMECATRMSVDEIEKHKQAMESGENPRNIKMRLARELVTMYHSSEAAQEAEAEFVKIFQKKDKPTDIAEQSLPEGEYGIVDLVVAVGFAPSKNEARRLVEGGGVSLDDVRVVDTKMKVTLTKTPQLLQVGKRHFVKVMH